MSFQEISGPIITYPNGGEKFIEGSIDITWKEPTDTSFIEYKWYEIFITDNFEENKKAEWLQIGAIPAGKSSYSFSIQKNLRGKKCRIGIRSVNHEGTRSKMSVSADDFIIQNESLPYPSLMEPVEGNTYFSYIPFIFDHQSIVGRCSQRSFYQIYYKSDNQSIDWTLLKENIMVGSDPTIIDISNFYTGSDYYFKVELIDGDNVSQPVFIKNVNINNISMFLIDTLSPKGSVSIEDNDEYTKETSFILNLAAADETSGVKDVQIQQTDIGLNTEIIEGGYIPLSSLITFDLKGAGDNDITDGVKLIQARYRDYGNNTLEIDEGVRYFRTYKNIENRMVTAFIYSEENGLYSAFAGDDENSPQLYKNLTFISTLDGDATSLKIYNNVLYVAIKDDENKGILLRESGGSINTVSDNDAEFLDSSGEILNSLYLTDSVINSMEVFDNTLFLGLSNGSLLSFKGSSVATENDDYLNVRSVNTVKTDGNLLYITFNNTKEILVMNKDANGNYLFNVIDTEN